MDKIGGTVGMNLNGICGTGGNGRIFGMPRVYCQASMHHRNEKIQTYRWELIGGTKKGE
jgi:hypothetical protein